MAFVNWSEELSVGVDAFDNDHKKLVNYINELHMGLVSGAKESSMEQILDGLVDYTEKHFKREEETMQKHMYPGFDEHKEKHKKLIGQVHDYQEQFGSGKMSFSLELMSFLRDWLVNHIQGIDMKYKDFFNEKGVN